jgi:hypothetical protein
MSTIVTRAGKGSPLTWNEVDNNFTNLNTDKLEAATTSTLTNKTINLTSNTLTGTTAQFNTALSDGDFATLAGTETLTNKTITSPTITGGALNGTLGATTPSTVAATTISASGVSTFSAGSAGAPAITTAGDTNTGIFFPAADTIAFAEGGAEAMRIDSSGNVQIGTSTDSIARLTIRGTHANNAALWVGGTDANYTGFAVRPNSSSNVTMLSSEWATATVALSFGLGGTEKMRLDTSGNLLVGITSTSSFLDGKISSYGTSTSPALTLKNDAGGGQFTASFWNAGTSGTRTFIKCVTGSGATDIATFNTDGTNFQINANSNLIFGTNTSTERMRIDSSGNLGLGVTASAWNTNVKAAQLASGSVYSYSTVDLQLTQNCYYNTSNQWIYSTTAPAERYSLYNGAHNWYTAPSGTAGNAITFTQAMTLDTSGNLLVGTTSAADSSGIGFKYIASATSPSVALVGSASTNGTGTGFQMYSTGAGAYRFYVGYGGTIFATSTTITAISDQRLKENIRDLDYGLNEILALQPRRFDWKEGKGLDKKDDVGFIAQEFETVLPNSVGVTKAGEDSIEYKNLNHSELIPTLVKAIQEQQAMINELKAKVAALEAA